MSCDLISCLISRAVPISLRHVQRSTSIFVSITGSLSDSSLIAHGTFPTECSKTRGHNCLGLVLGVVAEWRAGIPAAATFGKISRRISLRALSLPRSREIDELRASPILVPGVQSVSYTRLTFSTVAGGLLDRRSATAVGAKYWAHRRCSVPTRKEPLERTRAPRVERQKTSAYSLPNPSLISSKVFSMIRSSMPL